MRRQAQCTIWCGHLKWIAILTHQGFKTCQGVFVAHSCFFAKPHDNSNQHWTFFYLFLKSNSLLACLLEINLTCRFIYVGPNWGVLQRPKVGELILSQGNSLNIHLDVIVFVFWCKKHQNKFSIYYFRFYFWIFNYFIILLFFEFGLYCDFGLVFFPL